MRNDLVITLGARAPELVAPRNAGIFNPDGSLNHVVDFPSCVEHIFKNELEKFEVEGFSHLEKRAGEIVFFSGLLMIGFKPGFMIVSLEGGRFLEQEGYEFVSDCIKSAYTNLSPGLESSECVALLRLPIAMLRFMYVTWVNVLRSTSTYYFLPNVKVCKL